MLIGGFQEFTLIDYPGKMACVIFTQGCNFRCPFCHNGELIPLKNPKNAISEKYVINFLLTRMRKLDAVVITGGEPTIQPALIEFCEMLKELGFLVKLDTNGSNPKVLKTLIDKGLVDYFAMDIKAPWDGYRRLTRFEHPLHRIIESTHIIAQSGLPYQFRTTNVQDLLSDDDILEIKKMIPKDATHIVQKYNPETACDSKLRKHIVSQDLIIDPLVP